MTAVKQMRLLVSPKSDRAEAIFTGCMYGRRTQSTVVELRSLELAAAGIDGMREAIREAREKEAREDWHHTMGARTTSISFGLGHFRVRGYGPNADPVHAPEEWRGKLNVEFWTKRRGYASMRVMLDDDQAAELADVLRHAAHPETTCAFEWDVPTQ